MMRGTIFLHWLLYSVPLAHLQAINLPQAGERPCKHGRCEHVVSAAFLLATYLKQPSTTQDGAGRRLLSCCCKGVAYLDAKAFETGGPISFENEVFLQDAVQCCSSSAFAYSDSVSCFPGVLAGNQCFRARAGIRPGYSRCSLGAVLLNLFVTKHIPE